jgi:hypothetical protein
LVVQAVVEMPAQFHQQVVLELLTKVMQVAGVELLQAATTLVVEVVEQVRSVVAE